MSWLRSKSRLEDPGRNRMATADEIRLVVDAERDYLYWIALLITGDPTLADKCLIDATGLSTMSGGVFHDWLHRWARAATARVAAKTAHELLVASSQQYTNHACKHASHAMLSANEVEFLRQLNPQQVIADLNPFSRAMLIMRGIQGFSISDCAIFIEVPRRCVIGGYCHALRWFVEKASLNGHSRNSADPLLEILDGEE